MPKLPKVSDAEWAVMKVLWDRPGRALTAAEVIEALDPAGDRSPRTIKTLLARLLAKSAIAAEQEGRRFVYRAKVARDALVRAESSSFLDRVFDGALAPAMVQFLNQANPTPQELAELRRILDDAARAAKGSGGAE